MLAVLSQLAGVVPGGRPAAAQESAGAGAIQTAGVAPIPLYLEHCARCHGDEGDGRGPDSHHLVPPPTSFKAGRFKLKTTIPGTPPTVENVAQTIRNGMAGTSMPAFEGVLNTDQIEALVAYVFTLTGRTPSRRSLRVASVPDLGPNAVVTGKRLYQRLGCADCHGDEGRGDGPSVPTLQNDDGSPVQMTDLTRPWTFKGGWERIDIALRILAGMEGTPMTGSQRGSLRADQLYSLVDYVLSLRRAPDLRASAAQDVDQEPGDGSGLLARGRRLTRVLACSRCHTPITESGMPIGSLELAGGTAIDLYPIRRVVASNLTPHPTGMGGLGFEGFARIMRTGRGPDGRGIDPVAMPWPHYASLTDRDLEAIYAYLASLPPIANQIPATEPFGGLDRLLYKLRALAGGPTVRLIVHPGNAGDPAGAAAKGSPVADRSWVKLALALVVVLLVESLYLWRPLWLTGLRRRRRHHRTLRERVRGPVYALSVLVAAGLVVAAWWPPAEFGSPARTIDLLAPPLPGPVGASGDDLRIAERGRYLVGAAACASCHTAVDPLWPMKRGPALAGGMRIAWAVFGAAHAPNLTPDVETGLGRLSAAELKRILRSGLTPAGRVLHPAAMPWDLASGWTEEELEAVVSYLRSMPPVQNRVPASRRRGGGMLYTVDPYPTGESRRPATGT